MGPLEIKSGPPFVWGHWLVPSSRGHWVTFKKVLYSGPSPQPTSKPEIEWEKPSKPEHQKTSSIDWEPQNVLETAVGSKTSKNLRKPQMHQSLRGSTVTNYFKFSLAGTSTIVLYSFESPWASLCSCANTFCVEAWPRPGLAEPRSASIAGFGKRDLFHQHNRKGKIVMIETSRYKGVVFGFGFGTWNWYDFWRRSWGLPCSSVFSLFICRLLAPWH